MYACMCMSTHQHTGFVQDCMLPTHNVWNIFTSTALEAGLQAWGVSSGTGTSSCKALRTLGSVSWNAGASEIS